MASVRWVSALAILFALPASSQVAGRDTSAAIVLPDSPGATLASPGATLASPGATSALPERLPTPAAEQQSDKTRAQITDPHRLPVPCPAPAASGSSTPEAGSNAQASRPCTPYQDPYRPFVVAPVRPFTPAQKGYLSIRDIIDPFNLLTIFANSAFSIAIDAHTAYGPGMRGFGKNAGVSLLQDATGELVGTYAVCALFHQDPRYFRMPKASPVRRVVHVLSHVVIAQGDNGRPMINYENLITGPVASEISNLYVPGIHGNGPSTVGRIFVGYATEPIGNFVAEFLPDVARHIHIRVVIVQQILNQIASGEPL